MSVAGAVIPYTVILVPFTWGPGVILPQLMKGVLIIYRNHLNFEKVHVHVCP
jgi:hypothetical protein